jgi:hypothetical protein
MRASIIIVFLIFTGLNLIADEYVSPLPMECFSQNNIYKLVIFPRTVPDNYEKEMLKREKKPDKYKNIPISDTIRPCKAILYKRSGVFDMDYELIWEVQLENPEMPDHAFVSNDGSFIITIDDYYANGRSENGFVIYDANGRFLKKYSLSTFSPFAFTELYQTVMTTQWFVGIEHFSINPDKIKILIHDRKYNIEKIVYNVTRLEFEK